MKDEQIFQSLAALSIEGYAATDAPAPAPSATPARSAPDEGPRDGTTKSNDFRDLLYQRYTAPNALAAP